MISAGGFATVWHLAAYGLGWISPTVAAALMVGAESGRSGVRAFFRQILRWPLSPWYLAGLLLPSVALLAGLAADSALRGSAPAVWLQLAPGLGLVGPPLAEEYGWRGYALPRLQRLAPPLAAALLLGALWALWHLPTFFLPGARPALFWPVALWLVSASVLIAWLYNHTGGALTVALVTHAGLNLNLVPLDPVLSLRPFVLGAACLALAAAAV
ncbi:MAG TPA: CPBP family glutamic-type intramembrane protease, partial [Candidatus Acidoferrales bacterium]|nr:CPBP family glutamic-type intramembrane protease [Candidatus Acidoferrales bacterium]